MSQSSSVIPGWNDFFLETTNYGLFGRYKPPRRQSYNENYCEYVVQRLEFSILNVSMLANHLSSRPPVATLPEIRIANRFADHLIELVEYVFKTVAH